MPVFSVILTLGVPSFYGTRLVIRVSSFTVSHARVLPPLPPVPPCSSVQSARCLTQRLAIELLTLPLCLNSSYGSQSLQMSSYKPLQDLITNNISGFFFSKPLSVRGFYGSDGKESACNVGDTGLTLGWEDPLEKGMATHSSILAWKIPCTVHGVANSWTRRATDTTVHSL